MLWQTIASSDTALYATIGKYLRDLIFGANDGVITTLAVVAGVVGASLSPAVVLILRFANLLADGFSMGASNVLSRRSDAQSHELPTFAAATTHGVATFLGFVVISIIPLLAYLLPWVRAAIRGGDGAWPRDSLCGGSRSLLFHQARLARLRADMMGDEIPRPGRATPGATEVSRDLGTLLDALERGQLFWFADWPVAAVPRSGAMVYTIWNRAGHFIYVGMAGRGKTGGGPRPRALRPLEQPRQRPAQR